MFLGGLGFEHSSKHDGVFLVTEAPPSKYSSCSIQILLVKRGSIDRIPRPLLRAHHCCRLCQLRTCQNFNPLCGVGLGSKMGLYSKVAATDPNRPR